ncbi:MAG: serine hydrolase [Patescibacteria group bacterium]
MRFQALLLSLIILTSFLITGVNSPEKLSAEENPAFEQINTSPSLFVKDFYSAFKEKTVVLGEKTISASRGLTEKINQNADFLNQAASVNFDNFFSNDSVLFTSETALISETKVDDLPLLVCNSDIPQLIVKATLVKQLSPLMNSEQIVFELNSGSRWPIASLTKLMTSIITAEKIGLNKEIIMSVSAIATEGAAGSFEVGEIYKTGDLIKAMLVSSSNDAAAAIIENFGEKEFIDEMQKKAAELKMFQTSYLEPTGLSFINQSTANDLARLVNYARQNHPELLEISRQKEIEIFELKSKKSRKLLSVNRFAGQPDFIGGKTGYIEESGRNLIALFNINGKIILSIVLGADDSFKETEKIKSFIQKCTSPTLF